MALTAGGWEGKLSLVEGGGEGMRHSHQGSSSSMETGARALIHLDVRRAPPYKSLD
jgi:hypothetical protein